MDYSQNRFAVAPMIDWTDTLCRRFHRHLSQHALLYTEMITADAIIHGDRNYLLGFDPIEHPVAVQLAGNDPQKMAEAARIAEDFGYDEININAGCPSDRVQNGFFGACLMKEPDIVARCVKAMRAAVSIPVTVKCRLGVDDQDVGPALDDFAQAQIDAGVDALWIHARKAWLKGLSPKENRTIPPLDYDRVKRLKENHKNMFIGLNGGIGSLKEARQNLESFDGVMLGRTAYQTPAELLGVDQTIYGSSRSIVTPFEAVTTFLPILEHHVAKGGRLHGFTRHMIGLFHGQKGAKRWRQLLSQIPSHPDNGLDLLSEAMHELNPSLHLTEIVPS